VKCKEGRNLWGSRHVKRDLTVYDFELEWKFPESAQPHSWPSLGVVLSFDLFPFVIFFPDSSSRVSSPPTVEPTEPPVLSSRDGYALACSVDWFCVDSVSCRQFRFVSAFSERDNNNSIAVKRMIIDSTISETPPAI